MFGNRPELLATTLTDTWCSSFTALQGNGTLARMREY
jgi:hypothetical protein